MKWDLPKIAAEMIHYLHLREKNGGPARDLKTFRNKRSPYNYGQFMRSFGEAGAILALNGDPRGWTQIERASRYGLLLASEKLLRSEKPAHYVEKSDFDRQFGYVAANTAALGWCSAIAFANTRGAKLWADPVIAELNAGRRNLFPVSFYSRFNEEIIFPFVIELHCRAFGGSVQFPEKRHPNWSSIEKLLDNWDAPASELAKVLPPLYDFHCRRHRDNELFSLSGSQIVPYEILAFRQLRKANGLDFPEIDHPLTNGNPLAKLPESWERFEGDTCEVECIEYLRAQFPNFALPFDKSEPRPFVPYRDLLSLIPKPAGGQKVGGAAAGKTKGAIPKAVATVISQTKHEPLVIGNVADNATYPAELCQAIWQQFGCVAGACKKALAGRDEIGAESLGDPIADSKFGLVADWRDMLSDFLDALKPIAKKLGVTIKFDSDDGNTATATVEFTGKTKVVVLNYEPNGDTSMHDVVGTLQAVTRNQLTFLPLRDSLDSDTYCYAVLTPERVKSLQAVCKSQFDAIFAMLE